MCNRPFCMRVVQVTGVMALTVATRNVLMWMLYGLLLCGLFASGVQAKTGPWADTDHSSVRLVSAVNAVGDREELQLGLEFQMQPGWKIYWRSPGDAGFPPKPDWSRSSNVAGVEMDWPAPTRFQIFGLQTYGYADEVIFPLTVRTQSPGDPVTLAAQVDYLVCSDICIPGQADIAIDLPAGTASPSQKTHAIGRYASQVPGPPEAAGLSVTAASVDGTKDALVIQVALSGTDPMQAPDLYVEGAEGLFFGKPDVALSDDGMTATLSASGGGAQLAALDGAPLTLTVVDGARAIETTVTPSIGGFETVGGGAAGGGSSAGLLSILILAVLGGLILNLMPCVLPVLSIKLMSVVSHGGGNKADVRIGFLAASAGIVAMFLLLAAGLVALKLAGGTIGWGIQFQQPVFLAFMIVILTLFAANMAGLFEFALPRFVADAGERAGSRKGVTGHFLTGAFAALLATPCSAPFLGTAVGFALSRGPAEILLVFGALGLGLAIPYLAVAAFPGVATALPRPGPWMIKLKWFLGLALAGTAVWLASVLAVSVGAETTAAVGALAVLAAVLPAVRRLEGSKLGRVALPLSVALGVAAVVTPVYRGPAPQTTAATQSLAAEWVPFDRAAIARHVADGKVVFVDVTADWCITCQFNKKRVLEAGEVAALLNVEEVVAMRADWTRPDQTISDYLASYGRYGIPFNVVYGPGAEQGIPLPEILTETDVLAAFDTAGTGSALARR